MIRSVFEVRNLHTYVNHSLTLTLNLLNRLAAIGAECMNTVNRRKQTNNTWNHHIQW